MSLFERSRIQINKLPSPSLVLHKLFCVLFIIPSLAYAQDNYSGYESIVKELTSSRSELPSTLNEPNALDAVKFHAGVGLVSSQVSLRLGNAYPSSVSIHGYEVRFGIDLLSNNWEAEGAVRSFDPEITNRINVQMREFDLMVLYKNKIRGGQTEFNIGGGMSSRYLDLNGPLPPGTRHEFTTPSSVITLGLRQYFARVVSLGASVSYRSPFISETIDRGSFDGSLNVAGHF